MKSQGNQFSNCWEVISKLKWILIFLFAVLEKSKAVTSPTFGFYPDRDEASLFTLRIPRCGLSYNDPDAVNVMVQNAQGYICADEKPIRDLEISGLSCSHCANGKLLIRMERMRENETLSISHTELFDKSKRMEICSLRPHRQKSGEPLVVISPKELPEDACRWVFRDAGGSVGCCYSNRDYYTQDDGCDPRMQSADCRKGSDSPLLIDGQSSCILRISNPKPADSGNYLSAFQHSTPGFKKVVIVKDDANNLFIIKFVYLKYFLLTCFLLLGIWRFCLFTQRKVIRCRSKESLTDGARV